MGGPCIRRDLVPLATAAGAAALISLVPQWGANHVLQPTLIDASGISIPVIGAGSEPSAALLAAVDDGTQVTVHVDVKRDPATVDSVFAELPGANDTVVMLGGHLDSVLAGPGINDNGSGVATLLAMAESVADGPAPASTVRFAFWAAEEFGDIGSRQYVQALSQAEREQIRAYLNLDMVASPNAGLFVYDDQVTRPRSAHLGEMLVQALTDSGPSVALHRHRRGIGPLCIRGCRNSRERSLLGHRAAVSGGGTAFRWRRRPARRPVLPPVLRHARQHRHEHGPDPRNGRG